MKVFNRFEQGSSALTREIGIGLSLLKENTLMHHREIKVGNTLGKGTCFAIKLPLNQSAKQILDESLARILIELTSINPQTISGSSITDETRGSTIVIVKDNSVLRHYKLIETLS